MARGDDLHAIKYLPLKLQGPAWHWLNSLPANSIGSWENLEDEVMDHEFPEGFKPVNIE